MSVDLDEICDLTLSLLGKRGSLRVPNVGLPVCAVSRGPTHACILSASRRVTANPPSTILLARAVTAFVAPLDLVTVAVPVRSLVILQLDRRSSQV